MIDKVKLNNTFKVFSINDKSVAAAYTPHTDGVYFVANSDTELSKADLEFIQHEMGYGGYYVKRYTQTGSDGFYTARWEAVKV